FFAKKNKLTFFLWGAAVTALFLAFGRYTPLYKLAYYIVPGLSLIRYPVKYLFLTTFCLAFLSALGFEQMVKGYDEKKERYGQALRVLFPVFLILLAFSLAGYFFTGRVIGFFVHQYSSSIPAVVFETLGRIIQFNLQSFFNLTTYIFIFCLLLLAAGYKKISKNVLASSVILIAAIDLLANGYTISVAAPAEVFSLIPPNYTFMLKDRELQRFFYTPKMADENRVIAGDNYGAALFNAKDNFTANWHVPYQLFDFSGYESIEPYKFARFYRQAFRPEKLKENFKYLRLFNVKYLISDDRLDLPGLKLLRHKYKYGLNVYIYENTRVLPRAYLLNSRSEPDFKIGKVAFTNYRPGYMALDVETSKPATLFLSEAYYPGWRAQVDGREAKILDANMFFSAIAVAPGGHEVKFVYDPLSLKIGAGI
ncbi:MAG: YfhO family protein, partial [Candidatus Margulisbacteria bacterium]|nr:YfhO family protein [Candidatus Margulisiibacteriota bacterium]